MSNQQREVLATRGSRMTAIAPPPCRNRDRRVESRLIVEECPGILNRDGSPSASRMVRSYKNGCYQHLMFLGVCGFVICNHNRQRNIAC